MKNRKIENNLSRNLNWWYLFFLSALFTGGLVILGVLGDKDFDFKNPTESLALSFRLFFAFFAALSFWGLSTYVTEQIKKDDTLKNVKDPSTRYLTIAMAIFGLSSLLKLINLWCPFYETFPFVKEEGEAIISPFGTAFFITILAVLSTVNSLLILWAIIHIDLDKVYNGNNRIVKWVKSYYNNISQNKESWKTIALGIARLVIAIEIVLGILYSYDVFKIVEIINIPDLLYSFLTCIVLGVALFTAFILREMRKVAGLAILMTVITLVSQYYSFNGSGLSQYFLSLSYTTTFVMLLFSLEVSFLGEKKNTALENQKEQYKRFVEIVGTVLKKGQVETYFNDIAQKLKKEDRLDYRLAIAVKSNKNDDNVLDTIENPQANNIGGYKINYILSEYKDEAEKDERKIYSPQDTLAGVCIKKGEPVIVPGFEGTSQFEPSDAGKAKSLIFVPLKNRQGECFGAITLQFNDVLNEARKAENIDLLNLLADIFSNCIDPEKYIKEPIDLFLDELVCSGDGDGPYHFVPNPKDRKKAREDAKGYAEIDQLLKWSTEVTEDQFHLVTDDEYDDRNPLNQMLKGVCSSENVFSNGMVLFAGIVAFEHLRNEETLHIENPFMTKWWKIFSLWGENKESGDIKDFFRCEHDELFPLGKFNDNNELKKERFKIVYKLFCELIYYENQEEDSKRLKKNNIKKEINIKKIEFDIKPQRVGNRKAHPFIYFEFGINNIPKLETHIEYNKHAKDDDLAHGLSSTIIRLERCLPKAPEEEKTPEVNYFSYKTELLPKEGKRGLLKIKFPLL